MNKGFKENISFLIKEKNRIQALFLAKRIAKIGAKYTINFQGRKI